MRELEIKEQPIRKCVSCDRFFVSGRWTDRIEPQLAAMFGAPVRILATEPKDALAGRMPKRVHLQLELAGDEPGIVEIDLPAINEHCPDCQKARSNYFEGTLQLRGGDRARYDEARALLESHRGHVKQETPVKNGLDLKVSSNKAIAATLRDLQQRYLGIASTSATLHTRDHLSSRELHRVTGLFRFLLFEKGDVLVHEDRLFRIEKTRDSFCELRALDDDRTTITIPLPDLESHERVEPFDTSIVATRPSLSILDESYVAVSAVDRSGVSLESSDAVRAVGRNGFYAVLARSAQD